MLCSKVSAIVVSAELNKVLVQVIGRHQHGDHGLGNSKALELTKPTNQWQVTISALDVAASLSKLYFSALGVDMNTR